MKRTVTIIIAFCLLLCSCAQVVGEDNSAQKVVPSPVEPEVSVSTPDVGASPPVSNGPDGTVSVYTDYSKLEAPNSDIKEDVITLFSGCYGTTLVANDDYGMLYSFAGDVGNTAFIFSPRKKYGLMNGSGQAVTGPVYDTITKINCDSGGDMVETVSFYLLADYSLNNRGDSGYEANYCTIAAQDGSWVYDTDFSWAYCCPSYIVLKKGDHWMSEQYFIILTWDGDIVADWQAGFITAVSEGYAVCMLLGDDDNYNYSYIDLSNGKAVLGPYERGGAFFDGLARVRVNGLYGYMDTSGEMVISATFDEAEDFNGGKACVKDTDGYKVIDTAGEVLFRTDLGSIYYNAGVEIYTVYTDNEPLHFSSDFNPIIFSGYTDVYLDSDRYPYFLAQKDGDTYLLTQEAEINIGNGFVSSTEDGLIVINSYIETQSGFVWSCKLYDDKGDLILGSDEHYSIYFSGGYLVVKNHGGYYLCDTNGERVLDEAYDSIEVLSSGLIAVQKDGYMGVIDFDGNWLYRKYTPSIREDV